MTDAIDSMVDDAMENDSAVAEILDKYLQGEADKKGVTEDNVDPEQLKMGIEVEMEHTDDPEISKNIALDHLAEIPDYYTRLAAMEAEALGADNEEEIDEIEDKDEFGDAE